MNSMGNEKILSIENIKLEARKEKSSIRLPTEVVVKVFIDFCFNTPTHEWSGVFSDKAEIEQKFQESLDRVYGSEDTLEKVPGVELLHELKGDSRLLGVVCSMLVKLLDACHVYKNGRASKSERESILGSLIVDNYYETKRVSRSNMWDKTICLATELLNTFPLANDIASASTVKIVQDYFSDAEDYAERLTDRKVIHEEDLPPSDLLQTYEQEQSELQAELEENRKKRKELKERSGMVTQKVTKQKMAVTFEKDNAEMSEILKSSYGVLSVLETSVATAKFYAQKLAKMPLQPGPSQSISAKASAKLSTKEILPIGTIRIGDSSSVDPPALTVVNAAVSEAALAESGEIGENSIGNPKDKESEKKVDNASDNSGSEMEDEDNNEELELNPPKRIRAQCVVDTTGLGDDSDDLTGDFVNKL